MNVQRAIPARWVMAAAMVLALGFHAGAQEARLPGAPITVTLENPQDVHAATYGRRSTWVRTLATDSFELRATLWLLLGEPVEQFEVRTPRVQSLIFEADAGYANRVEIRSIGDVGETRISKSFGDGVVEIFVSQDVLDRIVYYDFSFSIGTHRLSPLPDEFYTGTDDRRSWSISAGDLVYVHSRNTGVLARPGQWGWSVPGSAGWDGFLSPYAIPLDEDEYELPDDRRMDVEDAREAFRRMLHRHHVERRELFVNDWFDLDHLRIGAGEILSVIYEHRPAAYARIMEREQPAAKDVEVFELMAGVRAAYASATDDRGALQPTPELDERVAAADRAVAGHGAAVSDDVRRAWTDLRQRYADAVLEGRLAGFRQALSGLTDANAGSLSDATRRQVAALLADAEGTASPRLLHRIRAVERLVNLEPQAKRGPSSLLLLIDTSGSMDGEVGGGSPEIRIKAAKQAATAAIERAAAGGRVEVAVLAFSGECADPVPHYEDFTTNVDRLTAFIDGLQAGGGTPMAPAVAFANRFMRDRRDPQSAAQMIVLLADGDNDCGDVTDALAELKASGIVFRHETVGFGIEPGSQAAAELRAVAAESGGVYHHAASATQLADLFLDVVDPFTVMDLFGMMGPTSSIGDDEAQGGSTDDDTASGATSMFGMFGSATPADPADRQGPEKQSEAGVTSMLGMFAAEDRKADSAGALAIAGGQGERWGWATGHSSAEEAERRALAECGTGCRVVVRFSRGCAAYAADQTEGSTAAGWASGHETDSRAREEALRACADQGGANCVVRAWTCG